jgi:signal transduction histidine kinase/DNA-binding response OmpR family regulator
MTSRPDGLSILVVDDRPDKLLAMEAILSDLCDSVVLADSGRSALRCLLERDFALILLDVNMPGMDGFETAALVRQRKNSEHTPIIFITAFGDDMHMARGYSLGAVDYILAPVVPEVLRTKVTVFLDLYQKTREIERQAERLRERAAQLHKLTEASLSIHSAMSMEEMLRVITDTARDLVAAQRATTVTSWDENWSKARQVISVAPHPTPRAPSEPTSGSQLHALWVAMGKPGRLSPDQLARDPIWQAMGRSVPLEAECGWLAAPLTGRDGRSMGLIHVSNKAGGHFSGDDEAVLLQLAQMASIAIENTLNSEAREANRIKDEFLATLSHELRTPLTAMLGWTQLLRAGALDEEETAHGLEIIERNVMAQAKLIDDLLDVSRIITGKLRLSIRPVNLVRVIHSAIDVVGPAADAKSVELGCQLESTTAEVSGDPDRLQQVIWNLLVNAIKFTPAGGRVLVGLNRAGPMIEVEVSDTGEGIPPEFLPHIFDRFRQADSTTRRSHGGLGLGLAIVRHVVELHGGHVRAESEGRGKGSRFFVRLPVAAVADDSQEQRPDQTEPQGSSAVDEAVELAGLKVLVVDDEADGREVIGKVLSRSKAEVILVASVREALEAFDHSPPDVLISDIGMPEEDGYDLIRAVRQRAASEGGRVPAMALTAFAREEDSLRAVAAGFQVHASKPIEPRQLTKLVAQLGGRGNVGGKAALADGDSSPQEDIPAQSWLG